MQPRVTAILVARNGETHLGRTLEGVASQTRRPDALIVVDAGSSDGTAALLAGADATVNSTVRASSFGDALQLGLRPLAPTESPDEWLWLLSHETAPHPTALAALLHAVEIAPSVAVAGPKLVAADDRDLVLSYGVSVSGLGSTVPLVDRELDQAQHDVDDDVLGVEAQGMLVRRSAWDQLGGFDPGLPTTDAGLDLSVRARLAGHRVVRVPEARVARAARPEDFGRRKRAVPRVRRRIARAAQLHRRLVYAPAAALPFHWLSLVPLALLRSIGHLLGKHPGAVPGEFSTAFRAAFASTDALRARRRIARGRSLGWAAIAPLRIGGAELRERRSNSRERDAESRADAAPLVRADFFSGGGVWAVLIAAVLGIVTFWRLIGAAALEGGALLPLTPSVAELWSRLGVGWHDTGGGFTGPADPFSAVLAVLGSLTPWSPSVAIVALWLLAMPLAALGAWWCATRMSEHAWPPALAALLWALAPPLLNSLGDGRIGAVIAHLALPWLVLAAIEGARSWSAAATAGILFALVTASAPSLAPALLLVWLAWMAANPRRVHRLLFVPIPAVTLFLPLLGTQLLRGTPLAVFADPGVALSFATPSGWELALGQSTTAASGWPAFAEAVGVGGQLGHIALAILFGPIGALALAALYLPRSRRAIPALAVALVGLLSAVAATHLAVSAAGAATVAVWPGAGLSLYWLGLLGALIVGVEALGRVGSIAAVAVLAFAATAVAPLVAASLLGESSVRAGDGRILPVLVTARAANDPDVGTLLITPQDDGSIRAELQRGTGQLLDEQSTLVATRVAPSAAEQDLALLAGNLASRSGLDPAEELERLGIVFVVLTAPEAEEDPAEAVTRIRVSEGLDGTPALTAVGDTQTGESVWSYTDAPATTDFARPSRGADHAAVLLVQAIVFGAAVLLAIPTRRRRRVVQSGALPGEDPADTFAEDEDG